MDENDLPDFLALNGFGVRPGMFASPRRDAAGNNPLSAPVSPSSDPFARALDPLIGQAAPAPYPFTSSPFVPPAPSAGLCPLFPLDPSPGSVVKNEADLRFSPAFANIVRRAADILNRQGMHLNISNGFRTAADQLAMTQGGSGKNPAARHSDHQLGNGIDINGTGLPSFPKIVQAFMQAGAKWGGNYRGKKGPPHFYIRPVQANAVNTAECEGENPR